MLVRSVKIACRKELGWNSLLVGNLEVALSGRLG